MTPEEKKNRMSGVGDAELNEALKNFRQSVHAWSDASYNRPRAVTAGARTTVWRRAAGWAMGCVLVAGVASGGLYQHERQVEQARQAKLAQQQEDQRSRAAAQRAAEDEDALLKHVDSDISRQVPAAMDPLAGLVDEETSKQP
jgi:hypothetical protein